MMKVDNCSGLLDCARQIPSPNQDDRPAGVVIDLVVIHNISLPPREFGGPWIDALFCNCLNPAAHEYFRDISQLRVSAHLLIARDGRVTQYVPFQRRAWHAGESCFQGRDRCNDFSIGIELEGDDVTPYEDVQYKVLADAVVSLMRSYPEIGPDRIVGHSDIAPGRKTDPGPAFDWDRFRNLLLRGPILT